MVFIKTEFHLLIIPAVGFQDLTIDPMLIRAKLRISRHAKYQPHHLSITVLDKHFVFGIHYEVRQVQTLFIYKEIISFDI